MKWKSLKKELRNPYLLTLLVSVAVYCSYWSVIATTRYYDMTASVYDLGLFMQHTWMFTQLGSVGLYGLPNLPAPLAYLALVIDEPVEFLLSPISLLGSYPAILVFQSVALGLGAIPLYAIGRKILSSERSALLVALAYLLYFPLGGVNWFDAHFIAFLIPLFLVGFHFFIRRSFRWAAVFLLAAGATEYPSMLLVVLFAATLIAEASINGWILKRERDTAILRFSLLLFFVSLLFFCYQFLYLSVYLGAQGSMITAHLGGSGGVAIASGPISLQNRVTVVLLILAPVLFLPILSPRWLVMLAPILYSVFGTTYVGYSYPSIFRTQYCAVFIPFVFLGVIYAIQWMERFYPVRLDPAPRGRSHRWLPVRRLARPSTMALAVLVAGISFASVYQPYGPLNGLTGNAFTLAPANSTKFDEVQELESLVPSDTPFVLFQNDMPGMLPRPLSYLDTPLVSGIGDWQNVTPYDATQGVFPLKLFTGETVGATVDYMIDNPYSWGFTEIGPFTNNSMFRFIQVGYDSGEYGIMGEIGGMLVLARGYGHPAEAYVPYQDYVPASALWNSSHFGPSGDPVVTFANGQNPYAWDGPFAFLSPGFYTVRFSLMTSNNSSTNNVTLCATADDGKVVFGSERITGTNFSGPDTWTDFELHIYVDDTYHFVAFPGRSVTWRGALSIRSVQILQTAPGTPTYSSI